jgi:hypothetical protein
MQNDRPHHGDENPIIDAPAEELAERTSHMELEPTGIFFHLLSGKELTSVREVRDAVERYVKHKHELDCDPDNAERQREWGQSADILIAFQFLRAAKGIAKVGADGSIISAVGDGRELVVWPFIDRPADSDREIEAHDWLATRGDGSHPANLRDELIAALLAGEPVPSDFFGALVSRIDVRPKLQEAQKQPSDFLKQMQDAVAKFEVADAAFEARSDEREVRKAYRDAKDEVCRVFVTQLLDAEFPVYEQEDYSHSSDLGEGREINLFLDMKSKPPKKHKAEAIKWLRSRGKKRLDEFKDELLQALLDDQPFPRDLFRAMADVRIKIRRKTSTSWRG